MKAKKSETEIRMNGRYSIRRPGHTAWASTNNLVAARRLLREANSLASGHTLVDNRQI